MTFLTVIIYGRYENIIATQHTLQEWSQTLSSGFNAGGSASFTAGGDIILDDGTQVSAVHDAVLRAQGSITFRAAEDFSNSESSGWGLNFGINPQGFSIGGNVNSSESSATS